MIKKKKISNTSCEECCKNCKYWERYKLNPPVETLWGMCDYWNEKKHEANWCSMFIENQRSEEIKDDKGK